MMKILMPQLGETVSEGTITQWYKQAGDKVSKDELLLDVETDKVATEIPVPVDGTLVKILVAEGETVDVDTVLALLDDGSGIEDDLPVTESVDTGTAQSQPAEADSEKAAVLKPSASRPVEKSTGEPQRLSPAVRQLLRENKLDANDVPASGRDGRLTRDDVLAWVARDTSTAHAANANRIEFSRIRRVTADHMVRSLVTSPHVLQSIEVDFSAVDRIRKPLSAEWRNKHGRSLTYLPFIAHAVCAALKAYPRLNASVEKDALILHPDVNLAIAVDLGFDGLLTPVLRDAGQHSVRGFAIALQGLAEKARSGQATADDLTGGTYTLSNPGPFGTLFTAPIINQPQVAILSTDAVSRRPVVVDGADGESIEIRPVGILAQSFDHRAVDGAYSGAFLKQLKDLLQDTDWSSQL